VQKSRLHFIFLRHHKKSSPELVLYGDLREPHESCGVLSAFAIQGIIDEYAVSPHGPAKTALCCRTRQGSLLQLRQVSGEHKQQKMQEVVRLTFRSTTIALCRLDETTLTTDC